MPPPRPIFRTLDDVSRWVDEHEVQHRRETDTGAEELRRMIGGATSHIDRVAARQDAALDAQNKVLATHGESLAAIGTDVKAVGGLSTEAVTELRLAREERIARAAADTEKARVKKEQADVAEAITAQRKADSDAWNRRAFILGPFVVGIITAIVAAIFSHQH